LASTAHYRDTIAFFTFILKRQISGIETANVSFFVGDRGYEMTNPNFVEDTRGGIENLEIIP
jgi:hypothetical protein